MRGFDGLSREDLLASIARQNVELAAAHRRVAELEAAVRQSSREREVLREQVDQLQTIVGQLLGEIERLKGQLSGGGSPDDGATRQPPEWAKANRADRPKRARKQRVHGFARRRDTPTERVVHAPETCPDCGTRLVGGWSQWSRQVIELPEVRARVVEHVFLARACPRCRRRVVAPAASVGAAAVGQARLGPRLLATIATLRTEARLPIASIRQVLRDQYGLHLSVGELVRAGHAVAERGAATLAALKAELRASPVVHGDETGWREAGLNGYLWGFTTPTALLVERHRSRGAEVPAKVLGGDLDGTLVTDFYGGYNRHEGLHQRCWVHLLRDVHELKGKHPDDRALWAWAAQVKLLSQQACQEPPATNEERGRRAAAYEARLLALCQPFLGTEAPQRVLCERVAKFLPELFTFVRDPRVPPDNNAAERALRPLVVARKISGGTRSPQGSKDRMALASLLGTWRRRGLNPLTACYQMLTSPQA